MQRPTPCPPTDQRRNQRQASPGTSWPAVSSRLGPPFAGQHLRNRARLLRQAGSFRPAPAIVGASTRDGVLIRRSVTVEKWHRNESSGWSSPASPSPSRSCGFGTCSRRRVMTTGPRTRRDSRAFAITSTWCRRRYQRPWCCTTGRNPRSTSCRTRFDVTPRISVAPTVVVQYGWSLWVYRLSAGRSTLARSRPTFRCGIALRRMPRPTSRETLSSWMPRISTASAPLMPILGSPRPC